MRVRLFSVVLLFKTVALVAQIAPGAFVIAEERVGYAPYTRRLPLVAASDTQFLAVWQDGRETLYGSWAARVDRDGRVLDRIGFPVEGWLVRAVASDGRDFLIVTGYLDMTVTHVTADGVVESGPRFSVSAGDLASLVWTGNEYVLFLGSRNDLAKPIEVVVLDRDGRLLAGPRTAIWSGGRTRSLGAATNGTSILLAWTEDDREVRVAAFDRAELRRGTFFASAPRSAGFADAAVVQGVASDGRGYVVAWSIRDGDGITRSRARSLASDGTPVSAVLDLGDATGRRLAWDGSSYVSPASNASSLVRLDAEGRVIGRDPLGAHGAMTVETIASRNGTTLAIWREESPGVQAFHAERAGSLTRTLLSRGVADRRDPAVVWRGDHYLAVWREIDFGQRIVMGRFTADGVPLDGAGIALSPRFSDALMAPQLASDGAGALVAWVEPTTSRAHLVHVARDLELNDRDLESTAVPALHWNGKQYLAIATTGAGGYGSLSALRLRADGTWIDGAPVVIASYGYVAAGVGFVGDEYVIALRSFGGCFPSCAPSSTTLFALSLTSQLVPIGTPLMIGTWARSDAPIRVGERAEGLLFAWTHSGVGGSSIRAARIDASGLARDGVNGFVVGSEGSVTSVQGAPAGWSIVAGADAWAVSLEGRVGPRTSPFTFLPPGASSVLVPDGPAPLIVYRDGPRLVARFGAPARSRTVRKS